MTIEERQAELDNAKWQASQEKGYDCCGEFDYCKKCNKEEENPCAKAYDRSMVKAAKPAAKATGTKPAAKKATAKK